MGKTIANAMTFEKTPMVKQHKRKVVAVKSKIINEMPTHQIVGHLLSRHQTILWALAAVTTWTILIVK